MQSRIPAVAGRRDSRGGRRLRSERGAALVEVMMAALLVALAATAVFKGIDGASALSSGSKSRAIAAAIADDDQERLRALPPANLVDRNETNTVTRSGVAYKVDSSTRWVADRDATPDCNSATSRAGYLRILSTVTWPNMQGSRPVVASSFVAPPNGTVTSNKGALGIKILNEANAGVPGVSVSVSGAGLSGTTDANGCVYWDDVPQGNYSYTAQKTGYVDYTGNSSITRPIGVAGGQTRVDTAYLDVATSMNVSVVTTSYSGAEIPATMTEALPLHLANAKMAALNGDLALPASISNTRTASNLYPMGYGVFVGPCARENNPGSVQFNPTYPNPAKIYMPSIRVRVRNGTTYMDSLPVKYTLQPVTGSTCTATYFRTTGVNGTLHGAIARPEMPYGRYTVCTEYQSGSLWWKASTTADNLTAAGVAVDLNQGLAVQGRC
jgi:Tfp pilus assembly protein PilV